MIVFINDILRTPPPLSRNATLEVEASRLSGKLFKLEQSSPVHHFLMSSFPSSMSIAFAKAQRRRHDCNITRDYSSTHTSGENQKSRGILPSLSLPPFP